MAGAAALHQGIVAVHVLQDVGVQLCVVQGGVEHALLLLAAAFYGDGAQRLVPLGGGAAADTVEVERGLLGLQVLAGVGDGDERDAHLHLHLFAGSEVVAEVVAYIVAGQFAAVAGVELVAAVVVVPLGLHTLHGRLFLPVAAALGGFVHTQHEVDGKHGLRVVAEGAAQAVAFYLGVAHTAHHGAALIGEALAQVQQHVALPLGKGVALGGRAERGGHLAVDAVFLQVYSIVAGTRHLVGVFTAVVAVVHVQLARGGHGEQRAQLGTAHTVEGDMGESGEVAVVVFVGRRPPAGVLVKLVQVGAHHIEGHYRHHGMGHHAPGMAHTEVGGANEGVYIVGGALGPQQLAHREQCGKQKDGLFHGNGVGRCIISWPGCSCSSRCCR